VAHGTRQRLLPAPEHIQPFGFWLFERVVALRERLVPALRELQPPVVP